MTCIMAEKGEYSIPTPVPKHNAHRGRDIVLPLVTKY